MLPDPFNQIATVHLRHHSLETGAYAFLQADRTNGLFFIINGAIELRRYNRNGDYAIVHRASGGETFAEASLFSDRYHCDAVAVLPSEIIEIDRKAIMGKFQQDAQFALAIASRFASQTQTYRCRLEILAIRNAQERILAALAEGMIKSNLKTFAMEIGLSHEAVYRGLSALVARGIVRKTGRGQYEL